jgi:hypothetical protein
MRKEEKQDLLNKLVDCRAIAWDNCHKIYVLMDITSENKMREYGYTSLILMSDLTPKIAYDIVVNWYKKSCALKFVESITMDMDYYSIVPQR